VSDGMRGLQRWDSKPLALYLHRSAFAVWTVTSFAVLREVCAGSGELIY
jgi:hypothetical protein